MRRGTAIATVWALALLAVACGDGGSGPSGRGLLEDGYPPSSYDRTGSTTEPTLGRSESGRTGIDDGVPSNAADPMPGGEPGPAGFCQAYCAKVVSLNCEQGLTAAVCLDWCERSVLDEIGAVLEVCGPELMAVLQRCEFVCDGDEVEPNEQSCPSEAADLARCLGAYDDDDSGSSVKPPGGIDGRACTPADQCAGCPSACEACRCASPNDPSACAQFCG